MFRLEKRDFNFAKSQALIRLARWLGVKNVDEMGHDQLVSLVNWLVKQ